MEQLSLLLLLCFSMLVGSFLAGYVPMAFRMSDSKSRLLALLGSGILVGTALAIIIPEGVDSLYAPFIRHDMSSMSHDSKSLSNIPQPASGGVKDSIDQGVAPPSTWIIGTSLVIGFVLMFLIEQYSIYLSDDCSCNGVPIPHHDYTLARQDDDIDITCEEEDDETHVADSGTSSENKPIRNETSHLQSLPQDSTHHRVSIRGLGINNFPSDNNSRNDYKPISSGRSPATKVTPTLGLVIHAAADGIALGAAATTSHREIQMIIFLAIMLHKGPAAFSLVVFLLHRGMKHTSIRRHLLSFSLSAPVGALVTYFGLSQSGKEALRQSNATGIAMLFSAGTFLYVATVHVLPELVHNKLLSPKEMFFILGGAFLPILLAQAI